MQFEFTEPQTPLEALFGGFYSINAFGRIHQGDADKFKALLERLKPPPLTTVYLNTPGGLVEEGMKIGLLIRVWSLCTSIGTYRLKFPLNQFICQREFVAGSCASAGTLAFLGGRFRYLPEGSKFLVHQFFFQDPDPDVLAKSQQLSAAMARYIVEMKVDIRLMELSSSTSHKDISDVPKERLNELCVVNEGLTETQWTTQARNNVIYVRGERDTIYGHQKMLMCHLKGTGFLLHAIFESQNRDKELIESPVVEITLNGEAKIIDVSPRCERKIVNRYANVSVRLSPIEAQQIAGSQSIGLRVRASEGATIFLGAGDMPIEDGREQLETLVSMFTDISQAD